ncbi:MAG: PAS domain S-box protein [Desulfopila sp.]|jgi:PAS domain S-box-containing protein|nr:PAS domain S-box protein [Desulfopila sp.]
MQAKTTYEELEKRVQELEKIESEYVFFKEALRDSEDSFKRLFENVPLGYQSLDENGCFIVVNQTWLDALGYREEEIIGKSFADFLHPDWREHFKENFPRFKAIGEILGVEFEMVRKNGDLILVSFTGKISRDTKGDFRQTHCVFQDITERKRHEEELRMARELTARIIEDGPVAITLVDSGGKIVFANRHAERLFGLEKNSLEGLGYNSSEWFIEDVDGSPFPEERLPFRQVMSTGQPVYNVQHAITRPDAARKILSINGAPLHDVHGKVDRVVFVILDITERKQAEIALKESEEKYRLLFNLGVDAMFLVHNTTTQILECNAKASQLFGYTPQELLSMKMMDLSTTPEETRQACQHNASQIERIYRKKGGDCISVEVTSTHFELKHRAAHISVIRDITEQKRLEAEKQNLQIQLNHAQKMESIGRLAGGVAHDFNNMLGAILGYVELAMEEAEDNHDLHADLKEIQTAAQRSADLTKQLLTFARKQTISPRKLDLNDTVESMLNMLRRLIGEDIDLVWKPSTHLQPVKMDPSQIDQLLANLCVNARDAIAKVGKITIETAAVAFDQEFCSAHHGYLPGEYILLTVSDDGCGMDQSTLAHIFEPFFTTKERSKGTGLGLASVFGLVKQNDGVINVYSEPGQGTTFKIYLPAYSIKSDGMAEKTPELPVEHGNETILLVEDESAILGMTTRMLEKLGYTVVAAATPGEAIRLAHDYQGEIDLLMTDVVMPEMNGRELAKNLLSHYPDLKRLFMSGYTSNVIAHHGVLDEGVHFIQKPFSKKDLGNKLREVLEG